MMVQKASLNEEDGLTLGVTPELPDAIPDSGCQKGGVALPEGPYIYEAELYWDLVGVAMFVGEGYTVVTHSIHHGSYTLRLLLPKTTEELAFGPRVLGATIGLQDLSWLSSH